jgi:hypothetical protein
MSSTGSLRERLFGRRGIGGWGGFVVFLLGYVEGGVGGEDCGVDCHLQQHAFQIAELEFVVEFVLVAGADVEVYSSRRPRAAVIAGTSKQRVRATNF